MNYEALGRYTEAKEKIKQLVVERSHAALRVEGLVRDAKDINSSTYISSVKTDDLHEAVRQLADKNDALIRLVAEHNRAAGESGRPLIRID